jgi:hypothetical protein
MQLRIRTEQPFETTLESESMVGPGNVERIRG